MRWKKLFAPVENLDADEAKAYMDEHEEGTFTLLDVRQPAEYEQSHIPGAKLIPLPQLTDRLDELDPDKPLIVYCAVGGRSRAAGQLLSGKEYDVVYNLKGGIKAWEDQTAVGPVELGEIHLTGDETVKDILVFIYSMEAGLEKFYQKASEGTSDAKTADLLKELSHIETTHKEKLYRLYADLNPEIAHRPAFDAKANSALMEGGFDIDLFLAKNRLAMETTCGVLDIAMMLETQGLDLYLRYAEQAEKEEGRAILYDLAGEEKAHLKALGKLLEETIR
jgi:rhodanese-related sulfurtransferase/rubrerythrin